MFSKILKYDMKSVWRIWWIAAISAFGIGLTMIFDFRFIILSDAMKHIGDDSGKASIMVFATVWLIVGFIALSAFILIPIILCATRLYKNFYTDEGYLTFTLPVSREKLYLAKTVNFFIWNVATTLVMAVLVLAAMLFIPTETATSGFINPIVFTEIGKFFSSLWQFTGAWLIVYVLEIILGLIAAVLSAIGIIQLCLTIGSVIAKKHKIIASIAIYYGFNVVSQFVAGIVLAMVTASSPASILMKAEQFTEQQSWAFLALIGMFIVIIISLIAAVIHTLTLNTLERKFNLA